MPKKSMKGNYFQAKNEKVHYIALAIIILGLISAGMIFFNISRLYLMIVVFFLFTLTVILVRNVEVVKKS